MDEREQLNSPEDVAREVRRLYDAADAVTTPLEEKRLRLKMDVLKLAMVNLELKRRMAPVPPAAGVVAARPSRRDDDAAGNPQVQDKPPADGPFGAVPPIRPRAL